jgi:4-amino-4-deoxy-L-arabinose transferase-like glycosyltransferase
MSGLVARNGGRLGLAALAGILLLALVLRIDYAWEGREPVFDAVAYGKIAANLADGDGFTLGEGATQPASNYSPGLPLLVAGLYEMSGDEHERFARLVLALIGTLAVPIAYLIGRRLSGPAAGLIGAGAVAVYPALLEYQGMLMGEPLATSLLSGAILAMLWAADAGPARWLVPGVLLGGLALTRPEYLGVALLLALALVAIGSRDDWRRSAMQAAVMLAGVAVVVAPWTIRNALALDRFVPVSTGGGQVLFAGSYLPSGGDPEEVGREVLERHPGLTRRLAAELATPEPAPNRLRSPFVPDIGTNSERVEVVLERLRLEQILAALAAQRYPGMETDRALTRMGRERLWEEISERPLDYAGFVGVKIGRLWGHGPRGVMQRPGWELLHWALLAFALLGLIALFRRRRWEAVLLLTVFAAITATSAILVASPRRTLVMVPLVAALAGVGVTACRDSLARRWNR